MRNIILNERRECEKLWAQNKYYVLSKSHRIYLDIREYLKEDELDISVLREKIEKARLIPESKKDFKNAILHIWGYFKKEASGTEKQLLFDMLDGYMQSKNSQKKLIEYVNNLLKKYPNEYLLESTLFKEENYEVMA